MSAEGFLENLKLIEEKILSKTEEAEEWRAKAEATTSAISGDRVQTSSDHQKMANAALKLIEICEELEAEIEQLKKERLEVIKVIEMLPAKQYNVMHKVYILGMTFQQIADLQGKTRSGVSNMHRKAIKNVQAILDRRDHGKVRTEKRMVE